MRRLLPVVVVGPLLLAALLDLAADPGPVVWLAGVATAVVVAVLALRTATRRPPTRLVAVVLTGAAVVQGLVAAQGVWLSCLGWAAVALAGVLAAVAVRGRDLALVAVVAVVGVLAPFATGHGVEGLLPMAMATAMSTSIGIGLLVRSQRAHAAVLRRAVITEERTSMARELHDLVAHEVTGIVVLAQATGAVADEPTTRDALRRIERSGQQALEQIRAMVQALREETGDAALRPTARGTTSIRRLAEDFADDSGAEVTTVVEDLALEPAVDAALQRVAAEALTNLRRHSTAARRVEVTLARVGDEIRLRVWNDAAGSGGVGGGSGYGLVGVRERLALVGGTLEAGADGADAWVVEARVPAEVGR